jgi:sensor histidine kinase YesM
MADAHSPRRRWVTWVLVFGIWTALGVFTTSASYLVVHSARNTPPEFRNANLNASWGELLTVNLSEWYVWAVLSIFVFRLARRFPFERKRWLISLPVHLAGSVVFTLAATALSVVINLFIRRELPKPTDSPQLLELFALISFQESLLIYGVVVGVYHARAYYRRYRERELRTSQLEGRLAQAQLQVLKMQLHPHFLFNTLHAISALMRRDAALAERMLARLGDLLRTTLASADLQEVPLKEELEFIGPYLEIEQARLGPRLTVALDIDPEAMDARVPNLILQPLVENAILHGVAPRSDPGRVEISARRAGEFLCLEVRDDGPGLPLNPLALKEGVGLANTRARLQQLYGPRHRLELANGQARGLTATVMIPFQEIPPSGGDG